MAENETTQPAKDGEASGRKSGGGGRMLLGGFISLVVLAETALFFFLVPKAEDVAALAEARLIERYEEGESEKEVSEEEQKKEQEFSLGVYGVSFTPDGMRTSMRVECGLVGTVPMARLAQLKKEFESKQGRVRHAVLMTVRSSELEELQEEKLGLLRRRLLTTVNEVLSKEAQLLSIYLEDFQMISE